MADEHHYPRIKAFLDTPYLFTGSASVSPFSQAGLRRVSSPLYALLLRHPVPENLRRCFTGTSFFYDNSGGMLNPNDHRQNETTATPARAFVRGPLSFKGGYFFRDSVAIASLHLRFGCFLFLDPGIPGLNQRPAFAVDDCVRPGAATPAS